MDGWFIGIISFLYAGIIIVRIAAYVPTIRDLHMHKKLSANVHSYFMWSMTSGIAVLYSLFVLPDFLFRLTSIISFFACITILILGLKLRLDLKVQQDKEQEAASKFVCIEIKSRDKKVPNILPFAFR